MKTNDSLGLSPEERALVRDGQQAMDDIKKSFSHWVDKIGPALKMLKAKPGGDNHLRFKTMREEAGFGAIEPAVVSRLLKIMKDDKVSAVKAWHAALPTNKQLAWCSPAAITRHCPIFNKPAPPVELKPSKYDKLATEHAVVLEKLHRLEKQLADSTPHRAAAGTEAVLVWGDRKSRKVGGALHEQAKVGDGFYQISFNDRSCECTVLYLRDKEEGEEIAEVDIEHLCFEQARALAEQDWAKRQVKPDVTTASSLPASESALRVEMFKAKAESTPETKQVDQIEVLEPGASTTLTWKRQEDKSYKAIAGPGYYRVHSAPARKPSQDV